MLRYTQRYTSNLVAQLTFPMILLITFPALVFTTFSLRQQSAITRDEMVSSAYDATVQLADQINSELKSYSSISNLFYLDSTLASTLLDYRDGVLTAEDAYPLIREISDRYNAGISNRSFSVLVVANDGTAFGNALFGEDFCHLALSAKLVSVSAFHRPDTTNLDSGLLSGRLFFHQWLS